MRFGFTHLNDFTNAALVADARWIRTLTDLFNGVLPVHVKTFEPSQLEDARHWLANPV